MNDAPDKMDRDDWDDLYMDCEANGEGESRSMVRYAYEAGYEAAMAAVLKAGYDSAMAIVKGAK